MGDMSQVSYKKAGGKLFCPIFMNVYFFRIDSYYMDLSCCKSITKSFVM